MRKLFWVLKKYVSPQKKGRRAVNVIWPVTKMYLCKPCKSPDTQMDDMCNFIMMLQFLFPVQIPSFRRRRKKCTGKYSYINECNKGNGRSEKKNGKIFSTIGFIAAFLWLYSLDGEFYFNKFYIKIFMAFWGKVLSCGRSWCLDENHTKCWSAV